MKVMKLKLAILSALVAGILIIASCTKAYLTGKMG